MSNCLPPYCNVTPSKLKINHTVQLHTQHGYILEGPVPLFDYILSFFCLFSANQGEDNNFFYVLYYLGVYTLKPSVV